MKGIALLIATALATVLVVFAARNTSLVTVDVLMGRLETSLAFALIGAGLLGILIGGALFFLFTRRPPAKERTGARN